MRWTSDKKGDDDTMISKEEKWLDAVILTVLLVMMLDRKLVRVDTHF